MSRSLLVGLLLTTSIQAGESRQSAFDVVKSRVPDKRGRAVRNGRVTLLRGPIVYRIGKDRNAELLAVCAEPRNLVIDPASIAEPVKDDSIRPYGLSVVAKAWLNQDRSGEKVDVTLTEFINPSGQEVYFLLPNLADTSPVRLADDEIVSWPHESALDLSGE